MTGPPERSDAVRASEAWALLAAVAAGGFLRFAGLGRVGLSHFDEGVYCLWAAGIGYPFKELFAPPLFPLCVRASFALLGPSDLAALAVSALVGTATIPLVWGITRRWYGPTAAIFSAVLAACSTYHIAFSRIALTDATFTFWWLASLLMFSEMVDGGQSGTQRPEPDRSGGIVSPGGGWAVAAGAAVAAAANTKYNGFLVFVIATAALALFHSSRRKKPRRANARLLASWLLAGLTAALLYLPWFWHVHATLGYAALLQHQRGYTTGLFEWPHNFVTIVANQVCLTGWLGRVGPVLAALAAWAIGPGCFRERGLAVVGATALAASLAGDSAGWLIGILAVVPIARRYAFPGILQATWIVALVLLTPAYRPYPRLALPLIAAGWVAGGAIIAAALGNATASRRDRVRWAVAGSFGLVLAVAVNVLVPVGWKGAAIETNLESACRNMRPELTGRVFSFVRPPVLFYLTDRLLPVGGLELLEAEPVDRSPAYLLIDSPMLRDNPRDRQRFEHARDRLEEVARRAYLPSPAVVLDDFPGVCLSSEHRPTAGNYELTLYRVVPR